MYTRIFKKDEETDNLPLTGLSVEMFVLSRFFSVVGHVALRQVTHLDTFILTEMKRRNHLQEEHDQKKKDNKSKKSSHKRRSSKLRKSLSITDTPSPKDVSNLSSIEDIWCFFLLLG